MREVTTISGEVRFIPETHMQGEMFWAHVGRDEFHLTLERAKQEISRYRMGNPDEVQKEVIHEIE